MPKGDEIVKYLRMKATAAAMVSLFISNAGYALPAAHPVKVTGGMIVGSKDGRLNEYFGVPFAAPPVGDLRWRALPAWPTFDGSRASILAIGNDAALQAHPLPDLSVFPQVVDTPSRLR